jgi:tetratricopeptide (TPR) repeat protein
MACNDEHDQEGHPISLASHGYRRHTLIIVPAEGYTAAAIADLMNNGKTLFRDDAITLSSDAPDDGMLIATIKSSAEENQEPQWQVQESCGYHRQLTPAELDQARASGLINHAGDYIVKKDYGLAESCIALARQLIDHSGSWENSATIELLTQEAILLENLGRKAEGFAPISLAAELARRICGPTDPQLAMAECNMGELLLEIGRPAEAEPLLLKALSSFEAQVPAAHQAQWIEQMTGSARTLLAQARAAQKPPVKATKRRRRTTTKKQS